MNQIIWKVCLVASSVLVPLMAFTQTEPSCKCAGMAPAGKGTMYVTVGYNLDWYTKSDIHFADPGTGAYDFTLYDVKAIDRPGLDHLLHEDITIPQYSFRWGYWFNNKLDLGIEINYDHTKYVVVENQRVRMTGYLHGEYYDLDTALVEDFIRYEHTNGANYAMLNVMKRFNLWHASNNKHWISAVVKAGGGFVLPRTASYVDGNYWDRYYHVAGYVVGIDAGLRYDFLKYFFAETSMKGCFANYLNVRLYGDGRARQNWWSAEYIFTVGLQAPVKLF